MVENIVLNLLLSGAGFSQEEMAQSAGTTRYYIRKALDRIKGCGIPLSILASMDEEGLMGALYPPDEAAIAVRGQFDAEKWLSRVLASRSTRQNIWSEEYVPEEMKEGRTPLKYSQFCNLLRSFDKSKLSLKMPINRVAGKELFIDWCGDKAWIIDPETGTMVPVYVFVTALGDSGYPFARGYASMTQVDWIQAHLDAFGYYGGIPRVLIPDNTRTAVTARRLYETTLNSCYRALAFHYKVAVLPARVWKPRDKGSVENNVKWVQDNIFPWLESHGPYYSLDELNSAIGTRLKELCTREYKERPGTRDSAFELIDRPALRPLSPFPFEHYETEFATVRLDYTVRYGDFYYTVPYTYIKKRVEIHVYSKKVEFWADGGRIAMHPRAYTGARKIIDPGHMPPNHRHKYEFDQQDAGYYRAKAAELGEHVSRVICQLLDEGPIEEQNFFSCHSILRLSETYGPEKLDAACRKALSMQCVTRTNIHNILKGMEHSGQARQTAGSGRPGKDAETGNVCDGPDTGSSPGHLSEHENVRTDWR